jgi:hypothetical protein
MAMEINPEALAAVAANGLLDSGSNEDRSEA